MAIEARAVAVARREGIAKHTMDAVKERKESVDNDIASVLAREKIIVERKKTLEVFEQKVIKYAGDLCRGST
ncbi:hypothetical protein IW152_003709 [Coemansia sp. BCRC 34962]|nr:hypothetical protein IW152_003709 [Coemansia sp. BCRC 34962]